MAVRKIAFPIALQLNTNPDSLGYGSYYPYSYYNSSSSSGSTYYYVDSQNYWTCEINGTAAARHPVLHLTYTVLK